AAGIGLVRSAHASAMSSYYPRYSSDCPAFNGPWQTQSFNPSRDARSNTMFRNGPNRALTAQRFRMGAAQPTRTGRSGAFLVLRLRRSHRVRQLEVEDQQTQPVPCIKETES